MHRKIDSLAALLLATVLVTSITPLRAEEEAPAIIERESQTVTNPEDEKEAREAALKAEFEGYINDYPYLKEVKDELKGSVVDYAIHLKRTREPAFGPEKTKFNKDEYIIRIIVLDPDPKKASIIRMSKTTGSVVLTIKKHDSTKIYQGEKKGVLELGDPVNMSGSDFTDIERLIKKCDYFNMRTGVPEVAADSPTLLMEISSTKEHKLVERYVNAMPKDDFFALCSKLAKLTKLELGALTKE